MKKFLLLILSVFIICSCKEDESKEITVSIDKVYTVKDFMENKELQKEYIKKCKNGELPKSGLNCQNVFSARRKNNNLNLN
ncbi:EexN family lipoprotein [Aggregatibacter actinomycetemcomitans]|nr:EexN family lipoprotein [Aggregatibacter actinomycetemcomitans]KYK72332.1 hypothetical protein SA3096_10500 [Aggregatibacter actinomycetemcomitans serotype e str. SA3096]KYK80136.1 hypothetical protein SC936_06740 [Aggregatibacter actinomycetemcomitans serotype e str. SC936]